MIRTASDENGGFEFASLPPGTYRLKATHDYFVAQEIALILKPREVRSITLRMLLLPVEHSVDVVGEPVILMSTYSPGSSLLQSRRLERLPLSPRFDTTPPWNLAGTVIGLDTICSLPGSSRPAF